jgi:hypothetical protein
MARTLGANFSISEVKVCVPFRASRDARKWVGTEDKATSPRKGLPGKAGHGGSRRSVKHVFAEFDERSCPFLSTILRWHFLNDFLGIPIFGY